MNIISKIKNSLKKREEVDYSPSFQGSLNNLSHKCDILEIKRDLNELENKINKHTQKFPKGDKDNCGTPSMG